tara:strand:+ start:1119 stop:1928 length:810 start_codon:yes stop_codon:yes gene_type:complete
MKKATLPLLATLLAIGCTDPGNGDPSGVTLAELLDTDLSNTASRRTYDYFIRLTEEGVSPPPGRTDAGWMRAETFIPHSAFGIPVPLPQSNPFYIDGTPTGEPEDHYKLKGTSFNPGTDPNEDPLEQLTVSLTVYIEPFPIPDSYSEYRGLLGINQMNLGEMPTYDEIRPLGNPTCDFADESEDGIDDMQYVMQACIDLGGTCFRLSHQDEEGGADIADYIVPARLRATLLEECYDNTTPPDEEREISQLFLYEVPNLNPTGYITKRAA